MIRRCKDCPPDGPLRPAPHPGPRCATCHRVVTKARKKAAHEARVQSVYGLAPGDYDKLYAGQNGRCWICQRATGAAKRLAVDHDHGCTAGHPPDRACRLCVRGLLCGRCNHDVIGHLRSDPDALMRAAWYLWQPPARRILTSL